MKIEIKTMPSIKKTVTKNNEIICVKQWLKRIKE